MSTIPKLLDGITNDVVFSLRMLIRHRMHATACILTLAIGIGATTAVFSVVDATLLRPLPYIEPQQLVGLNASLQSSPDGVPSPVAPSQIEFVRWQAANGTFEAIEALEPRVLSLTGSANPELLPAAAISNGLFQMLGVEPQAGRVFGADEEKMEAPHAVISDAFSHRRFSGQSPLGQNLVLDGRSYQVVGVMPPNFRPLLNAADVWGPRHATVDPARQNVRIMTVAGRLRAGVTRIESEQDLAAISAGLAAEFPSSHGHAKPVLRGLQDQLFADRRPALLALGGAALLLLLLAGVNVLNLTLGHLAARRTELTIRAALGGGRWQLARLQLVESGLIAVAGGALGVLVMS